MSAVPASSPASSPAASPAASPASSPASSLAPSTTALSVGIVVAVYKENISWLQCLPVIAKIYLYVKDASRSEEELIEEASVAPERLTIVYLDNVGRESHTYLTHITTYYSALDDVLLFVQGEPLAHISNMKVLEEWIAEARASGGSGASTNFVVNDVHGTFYGWTLKYYDGKPLDDEEGEETCFGTWFEKYVDPSFPMDVKWVASAQFAVSKTCITQRSLDSYKQILATLQMPNPVAGHYMERSWYYVMNLHTQEAAAEAAAAADDMNAAMRPHVAIQNIHPDETIMLTNAFQVCGYRVTSFKHYEGETNDPDANILVLAANSLADNYIDMKPFVFFIVGTILVKDLMPYLLHPNFRGFIAGSIEQFYAVKELGLKAVFITKRYPIDSSSSLSLDTTSPTKITSLIYKYSIYGPQYVVDGVHSYQHFQNIAAHVSRFSVTNYGDEDNMTDDDAAVIAGSRYLIHIKYWGHVCNAVVKALALGVPVLMDSNTYNIGKYAAYIRQCENGIVFASTDDIISYLNDAEVEERGYARMKAACTAQMAEYRLPYPGHIVKHLREFTTL